MYSGLAADKSSNIIYPGHVTRAKLPLIKSYLSVLAAVHPSLSNLTICRYIYLRFNYTTFILEGKMSGQRHYYKIVEFINLTLPSMALDKE